MARRSAGSSVKSMSLTEFLLVVTVLLLLEAFLFYHFLVAPQVSAVFTAQRELIDRRVALENFKNVRDDSSGLSAELESLQAQIAEAAAQLPAALHNEDISITIGQYAEAKNIMLDSVTFQERQLVNPMEYAATSASDADSAFGSASARLAVGSAQSQNADIVARQSALFIDNPGGSRTLSLQGVQVNFHSEFYTVGPFLKLFEDGERKVRVRGVTLSRIQEGELKGVLNLEYASIAPSAEQYSPGLYVSDANDVGGGKDSLFSKYNGYVEEGADPTILLLSADDDVDPDFYIVLKASTSNETKVSYGVYPRVETEVRSNVNNAVRAKLSISGDENQFDYTYSLASFQKSEKRKLAIPGGKLRVKVLSSQRMNDDDAVAVLLDVDNNTDYPLDITLVNDDVLNPRFHLGNVKGQVNVVEK